MKKDIKILYYSTSKDEYVPIEDMAHEHLVNVLYKSVKEKGSYNANFEVKITREDGSKAVTHASLDMQIPLNFLEGNIL